MIKNLEEAKIVRATLLSYADMLEERADRVSQQAFSSTEERRIRNILLNEVDVMRQVAFNITTQAITLDLIKKKYWEGL